MCWMLLLWRRDFTPKQSHGRMRAGASCWEARIESAGLFSVEKTRSGLMVPLGVLPHPTLYTLPVLLQSGKWT